MAVDEPNVIDIVAQAEQGEITLIISDHLDWTDSTSHQLILQEKLNAYLRFIEGGELLETFPAAKDNPFSVEIVFHEVPDESGIIFLNRAKSIFGEANLLLTHRVFGAT